MHTWMHMASIIMKWVYTIIRNELAKQVFRINWLTCGQWLLTMLSWLKTSKFIKRLIFGKHSIFNYLIYICGDLLLVGMLKNISISYMKIVKISALSGFFISNGGLMVSVWSGQTFPNYWPYLEFYVCIWVLRIYQGNWRFGFSSH